MDKDFIIDFTNIIFAIFFLLTNTVILSYFFYIISKRKTHHYRIITFLLIYCFGRLCYFLFKGVISIVKLRNPKINEGVTYATIYHFLKNFYNISTVFFYLSMMYIGVFCLKIYIKSNGYESYKLIENLIKNIVFILSLYTLSVLMVQGMLIVIENLFFFIPELAKEVNINFNF
jgi:hypothetical protein